jgi:hypothetical protein
MWQHKNDSRETMYTGGRRRRLVTELRQSYLVTSGVTISFSRDTFRAVSCTSGNKAVSHSPYTRLKFKHHRLPKIQSFPKINNKNFSHLLLPKPHKFLTPSH